FCRDAIDGETAAVALPLGHDLVVPTIPPVKVGSRESTEIRPRLAARIERTFVALRRRIVLAPTGDSHRGIHPIAGHVPVLEIRLPPVVNEADGGFEVHDLDVVFRALALDGAPLVSRGIANMAAPIG